jgi:hypothetical protein
MRRRLAALPASARTVSVPALTAASALPGPDAVRRLLVVTLDGLRPPKQTL